MGTAELTEQLQNQFKPGDIDMETAELTAQPED